MPEYRNPITGPIKPVSLPEFLRLFDPEVHETLQERLSRPDVAGVVCFENQDFCSSQFGHRTAMIYGPGCSNQDMEEIQGRHLGEVPSRFQYPVAFCEKQTCGNCGRERSYTPGSGCDGCQWCDDTEQTK